MNSEIKTERLILRPWRESDIEPFSALNADPRVIECFPSVKSREESIEEYNLIVQGFEKYGWGFWAASLIDGTFIGFTSHFTPAVEIGWRLAREHWGHGYATERVIYNKGTTRSALWYPLSIAPK